MSATIRGDVSEKCKYLIDKFMTEVESSYILIGAFEIYSFFSRCKARSIPCEVRMLSVASKKDDTFRVLNVY